MSLMLDTYAIIELFRGSKKGTEVKKLLEADDDIFMSVLSIYETGTVLEREIGKKEPKNIYVPFKHIMILLISIKK